MMAMSPVKTYGPGEPVEITDRYLVLVCSHSDIRQCHFPTQDAADKYAKEEVRKGAGRAYVVAFTAGYEQQPAPFGG
jgi:hypothetical protein